MIKSIVVSTWAKNFSSSSETSSERSLSSSLWFSRYSLLMSPFIPVGGRRRLVAALTPKNEHAGYRKILQKILPMSRVNRGMWGKINIQSIILLYNIFESTKHCWTFLRLVCSSSESFPNASSLPGAVLESC